MWKKFVNGIFWVSFFLLQSGCYSLRTMSLTQIPKTRSKIVEARVEKTIFLGFNFDNDFLDSLPEKLQKKCPKGRVSGILTKDESVFYFLVTKKIVTARGYCI